jgi:hypothetical protein
VVAAPRDGSPVAIGTGPKILVGSLAEFGGVDRHRVSPIPYAGHAATNVNGPSGGSGDNQAFTVHLVSPPVADLQSWTGLKVLVPRRERCCSTSTRRTTRTRNRPSRPAAPLDTRDRTRRRKVAGAVARCAELDADSEPDAVPIHIEVIEHRHRIRGCGTAPPASRPDRATPGPAASLAPRTRSRLRPARRPSHADDQRRIPLTLRRDTGRSVRATRRHQ